MQNQTFNIIMYILGTVETLPMVFGIFCVPIQKNKTKVKTAILLFFVVIILNIVLDYHDYYVLINFLASILITLLLSEGRVFYNLMIYLCSTSYLLLPYFCIDLVSLIILGNKKLNYDITYRILRSLITILIIAIITVLLHKNKKYIDNIKKLDIKYVILALICSLVGTIVQNSINTIVKEYTNIYLSRIILFCLIAVTSIFYAIGIGMIILDILRKKYKEESHIKEQYLTLTREYLSAIQSNADETKKIRHDINSHLSILHYYLDEEKYTQAKAYMNEIQKDYANKIHRIISVNHDIADALLLQAQTRSEDDHIHWEVEGTFPDQLKITDYDLCTLLSNLLSNSIEACQRVSEDKRYIHIEIRTLNDNILIEIENPTDKPINISLLDNNTSKDDKVNHGYGIRNIKSIVSKYNGSIKFNNLQDIVQIKVNI